jgi:hypothetical protein
MSQKAPPTKSPRGKRDLGTLLYAARDSVRNRAVVLVAAEI